MAIVEDEAFQYLLDLFYPHLLIFVMMLDPMEPERNDRSD